MGIETKTIGTLIDELVIVNLKIFWALEEANTAKNAGDTLEVGKQYGKAQALNSRRSQLMASIDRRFGEEFGQMEKTF